MALDRRRQHVDVLERVLGSARDDDVQRRSEVVELNVRPWLAGITTSVVQVTVLGPDDKRAAEQDEGSSD
jgi:hypothetical protein